MGFRFERDRKEHEYRCYKDGELITYIYERYEPKNRRSRRYYYRVKDTIFYKLRDAQAYVRFMYYKSHPHQD